MWPLSVSEAWILVWPGELLWKMRFNYLALGGFLHKASKTRMSSSILPIVFVLTSIIWMFEVCFQAFIEQK